MPKYILFFALFIFIFAPVGVHAATLYSQTGAGGECCIVNGATGTDEMWSGTFTTGADYDLTTADIWASSQGGSDGLTLSIYDVSGGFPTGSPLFTSSTGTGWSSGSLNSQTVNFTDSCLPAGSYTFVIARTGARDATNNWVLGRAAGSGMSYRDSGVWSTYSTGYALKSAIYGDASSCAGPTPDDNSATSTIEQIQTNTFNGFIVFFISMFFAVWMFKKR